MRHNLVAPNFVFPHFVARIWSILLWSTTPFGRSHFGRLTHLVEPSLVDLEKGKMGHLVDSYLGHPHLVDRVVQAYKLGAILGQANSN